jgi:hypothetical protein
MLTAAGLAFDVKTLFYGGIVIFAAMAALWLWVWGRPVPEPVMPIGPSTDWPPPTDPNARTIAALTKARENAMLARLMKNEDSCRRAYHEIEAALLSAKREFGISGLSATGEGRYSDLLAGSIAYVDGILPHLREGHVDEARKWAAAFTF